MYLPPPPLSCYLVNPLIPSTAPPLPHTRSIFNPWSPGGAAHVRAVIWQSSPSDFPYRQPQIVMSSVVPVESWRSTFPSNTSSSQGCSHCTFSCITQSKWVLIFFGITLSFLTLLLTFYAIEPPLTQKGPRGLLALSYQMYLWLSGTLEKAFLKVLVNNMVYFLNCV